MQFSQLFSGPHRVDAAIQRAKALKHERQIYQREVKYLLGELDESLKNAPTYRVKGRLPGSRYKAAEVFRVAEALRSLLLATELVKRIKTDPDAPKELRDQAKAQLLKAIVML